MAPKVKVKAKREVVKGVGMVATVEVPRFEALLFYRPKRGEVETIVFPSRTCPAADLPSIISICEGSGYTYGPRVGLTSHEAAIATANARASNQQQQGGESSSKAEDGNDDEDDEEDPKSGGDREADQRSGGTGKNKGT